MVQNNPVKCTLEPFRRDTEAEWKTIIGLDCSESSRRSTGVKEAGQRCWGKKLHRLSSRTTVWLSLFNTSCCRWQHFFISEIINREEETAADMWGSYCGWGLGRGGGTLHETTAVFFFFQSEHPACTSSLRKRLNPVGQFRTGKVGSGEAAAVSCLQSGANVATLERGQLNPSSYLPISTASRDATETPVSKKWPHVHHYTSNFCQSADLDVSILGGLD